MDHQIARKQTGNKKYYVDEVTSMDIFIWHLISGIDDKIPFYYFEEYWKKIKMTVSIDFLPKRKNSYSSLVFSLDLQCLYRNSGVSSMVSNILIQHKNKKWILLLSALWIMNLTELSHQKMCEKYLCSGLLRAFTSVFY